MYTPQNKSTLQIFMWLLGNTCFFLFDPGQIRYRASVRHSSCFFYLLTHHNLYPPPNEIPGYAPGASMPRLHCESWSAVGTVQVLLPAEHTQSRAGCA